MKKNIFSVLCSMALAFSPVLALAHGHNEFKIGDKTFEVTIGSLNEPIAVDDKTGVDFRIKHIGVSANHNEASHTASGHSADGGVLGLEKDLKVEISAGDKKKVLDFSPAYNDPGAYRAYFIPTVQTTYTYRVVGKINGVEVSLPFTCSPAGHAQSEEEIKPIQISPGVMQTKKAGSFGCPSAKAELGFPEKASSLTELALKSSMNEDSVLVVSKKASTANSMAILGIVFGLLGLGASVKSMTKKP